MGLFGKIVGLIRFVFTFLIALVIIGAIIGLLPGYLPENMKFTAYEVAKTKDFKDGLSFKNQFKNVEKLFENEIHGPESLLYHKGVLYTTLHGGQVVRIVNDKIIPFVKFGKQCAGFHEEHICGRPLGLTVDKHDNLYVADAYYGLFKVNLTTKAVEQLVSPKTDIEGRKAKLFNSVAVSSDGIVYWTDSDSNVYLHDGLFTGLADGTGRLIRYDPGTKTNTVLIDRIRFANGVALSSDESFIVVAETLHYRLLRYHLKGPAKGSWDVFVDGLPGSPDNLKVDKAGYFYASLVIPRDEETVPSLIYNLHKYPLVRKSLANSLAILQTAFVKLNQHYPQTFFDKAIHAIGHFESVDYIMPQPKRFTLVVVNKNGRIVNSYHSLDGSLKGTCDVEPVGDYLYFGSPFNRYIARAKLPSEFKSGRFELRR